MYKAFNILVIMTSSLYFGALSADEASKPWVGNIVDKSISENVLYIPIADNRVKSIKIQAVDEETIDLLKIDNTRIKLISNIVPMYKNTYEGFSIVRLGLFKKLEMMLKILPQNIGIAYFEGFRPLWKQKEYFDKKFKEILLEVNDKNIAYNETTKHVSPFIDNIPTHSTGAAIDITLFEITDHGEKLLDMGMFDTIYGHNPAQDTFSVNTSDTQKMNRLLLLDAATKAGLVNYGFEWWHYSYGDKAWGYVKNKHAIYGLLSDADKPILSINKDTYFLDF